MKSTLVIICVLAAVAAFAGPRPELPLEDQQRIVQDYLHVLGRGPMSAAAALTAEQDLAGPRPPVKCGTSAIADYMMNRDRIDQRLKASLGIDSLQHRPTDLDLTYDSPAGHFKIHYTKTGTDAVDNPNLDSDGNGVPDYVQTMGMIADSVYSRTIDVMGYPVPPNDGFYPEGGDSLFDIYVQNLGSEVYGLTYMDSVYLGADSMTATSFMIVDNTFRKFAMYANRPFDAMRVTIAHEYFHAVQFGIDVTEAEPSTPSFVRRYWMEMSATWMEEQQYDNINDYYNYLPYFYQVPNRSIQQFAGYSDYHPYGSVVFPLYLSQKYGPGIIKSIWMHCGTLGRGASFLIAADMAIDSASNHTQDWVTAFSEFSLWNYFTGSRAGHAPNGIGFEERASYPAIPDSTQIVTQTGPVWRQTIAIQKKYPFFMDANSNPVRPDHNAASLIRFERVGLTKTRYLACGIIEPESLCTVHFVDTICPTNTTEIPASIIESSCNLTDTLCQIGSACAETTDVAIDTSFDITCGVDSLMPVWFLKVIYEFLPNSELGIKAESSFVESYPIVKPPSSTQLYTVFTALSDHPERFRSITYIFTPASRVYSRYQMGSTMRYFYYTDDSLAVDSAVANRPAAVMTPYPNPAVVSEMGGRNLKIRFQLPLDSLGLPYLSCKVARVVVDFFNAAGELVRTVDDEPTTASEAPPLWETEWDMKNASGKDVASGVYIGLARMYADKTSGQLLAESKVKVLIVR